MRHSVEVAIVGTGIIGQSWAIVFARAGLNVRMFDHIDGAAAGAPQKIDETLRRLVKGSHAVEQIGARIAVFEDLSDALNGVDYIQESTPEIIDIKREIFVELDELAPVSAIIASSTSALLPSQFALGLPGAHRCVVAHPLNPPHLIPAVELIPGPDTDPNVLARTKELLTSVGQEPVVLKKEAAGFIMNRLQGALLDEAFSLVRDGIADVADIDLAMRDGLARRWAITGPFETIDLNAPGGVAGFFERYAKAYSEIGESRPNRPEWRGELAERIIAQCRQMRSLDVLPERQAWRDEKLADLAASLEEGD